MLEIICRQLLHILPWSVGQCFSIIIELDVLVLSAQVNTVLDSDCLVYEWTNLSQYWLPSLHHCLGISYIKTISFQMSLDQ